MIFGKKSRVVEQREKIINYKQVFGTPQGQEVLFDLMNRFHILRPHGGDAIKEGERSTVLYILERSHINLAEFDKLMKGNEDGNY